MPQSYQSLALALSGDGADGAEIPRLVDGWMNSRLDRRR